MNNKVDRYIRDTLHSIQATPAERNRLEADLRAHFEEALAAGEPPESIIERMGTPKEVATEFMSRTALPYAGFWLRFAAFVIDGVIIAIAVAILGGLATLLSTLIPQQPQGAGYVLGGILIALVLSLGSVAIGVVLLYFPILEGRFGQTVGKRLLRLRVVTEQGLTIGYKESFLRRLSFYFEFLPIDALFIPFTPKKQRAMDIVARTVVLRSSD
jgi:uncharacterized RDD family membrane protein YckC